MRLRVVVVAGGEEEMRRVRRRATMAVVDDSGCNWKQRRKKMVADDSGREEQRWPTERDNSCCGNEGCGEGNEQRSNRGVDDGFGRKNTIVVGLKVRRTRQRVGAIGKRALGLASGWRATRATADVAAGGEEWLAATIEEESKATVKLGWKRLDSDRGRRGRHQRQG
ncbi:hypothetical protein BHM03_00024320 [Ensete ventricosum]|nr:hypothetical protein BHM03_00024320 [Ensete ventricosum]